jgi:hypothetical protein
VGMLLLVTKDTDLVGSRQNTLERRIVSKIRLTLREGGQFRCHM